MPLAPAAASSSAAPSAAPYAAHFARLRNLRNRLATCAPVDSPSPEQVPCWSRESHRDAYLILRSRFLNSFLLDAHLLRMFPSRRIITCSEVVARHVSEMLSVPER